MAHNELSILEGLKHNILILKSSGKQLVQWMMQLPWGNLRKTWRTRRSRVRCHGPSALSRSSFLLSRKVRSNFGVREDFAKWGAFFPTPSIIPTEASTTPIWYEEAQMHTSVGSLFSNYNYTIIPWQWCKRVEESMMPPQVSHLPWESRQQALMTF